MSTSIGVMLIPTAEHRYDDDSHITLVYAGEIGAEDQPSITDLRARVHMIRWMFDPLVLRTSGKAWFGEGAERVPVLTIVPDSTLSRMRQWVEGFNRSQYTTFRPHMTVPDYKVEAKPFIFCEHVALWVGDTRTTFRLGMKRRP